MTFPPNIGWYPFWFWNDSLTADEIRWQIAQMKSQGLRGFVLSPRQGLVQPYLADLFFAMVDVAVQAAIEHGLVVHLYDELPYPSGPAGGEVLLGNPHFFATALVQQAFDVEGVVRIELPRGKILNCVAIPLEDGEPDWERSIDLGSAVGVVLTENSYQEVGLTAYNRKRYFANVAVPTLETTLTPGPHRIFVSAQTTVEGHKYYYQFIDVLNPAAIAEFIRLTHERYAARFPAYLGNVIHSIFADETTPTWSECIPKEFTARMGYELLPLLPALQDANHPKHAQVKADLHRVKYELFVEAFEKPIAAWCRDHKITYWAEKLLLRLSQLQYSDVPGCDAGHVKARAPLDLVSRELRTNPRAAASAAYFYDKLAALCECYHSLGWGATLQDLKRLADGLLLHGINCFVPHAFFYSTHNLRKHDAPPSMFFQMPYWKFFGQMVQATEKVLAEFAGTYIDARVLVVDPTPGVPNAKQLDAFVRLQNLLLEQHVDYLFVDVDSLQSGRFENGHLRIKDLDVELVIVPPMLKAEAELSSWIRRFESAGGRVVLLDADFRGESLVDQLPAPSLPIDSPQVHLVIRRDANRTIWFLHNTLSTPVTMRVENPESGSSEYLRAGVDQSNYLLRLDGNESILLTRDSFTQLPRSVQLPLPAQWQIHPLNENLLPLRTWQMTLTHDDGATQTATAIPAPIIHQLTEGNFRYAPKVQRPFGSIATLLLPILHVQYNAEFHNAYAGPVHLVMEPGSLAGQWTVRMNDGQPLKFSPVDFHVRGSLGTPVVLQPGINRIIIDLQTDRVDGGLLNCLYLAGDFGVSLQPFGLIDRPPVGRFGEWEDNGLPFYAGVVEYVGNIEVADLGTTVELPIDPNLLGDDAYEVSFNGGPWRVVLWSPRWFTIQPGELRPGINQIRLRVYTTLLRAFEGQRFDAASHRSVDIG